MIPRKTPLRRRSLQRGAEPKRRKRVKPVNGKRKAANLVRAHGPAERRAWIKTLPCANCGIIGYSEGAHIKNGGMSRKADARFTIPLCGWHPVSHKFADSCHFAQYAYGWSDLFSLDTPEKREVAAERTENLWLAHCQTITGRDTAKRTA